jgi:hypothetical protein
VRICNDNFEAYDGEVRIACQKVEYTSGKIVWFKGQYQGLAERNGMRDVLSRKNREENMDD